MKQFVSSAFCLKCKLCCRFVHRDSVWIPHLTDQDISVLSKDTEAHHFISRQKTIDPVPMMDKDLYVCPLFTTANSKCRIYETRPFECLLYPFLINRKEGMPFLAVDINCPYVEERLGLPEFKSYVTYLTDLLTSPEWLAILRANPGIVHSYEGARNLVRLDI
jgi:Fe-S-cluster containining protein